MGLLRNKNKQFSPFITQNTLKWKNLKTKKIHEEINLQNSDFELALTGIDFKWIQANKPELIEYLLVKGNL